MTANVSIVMTVYNRAQYLDRAIASFISQTYSDAELLIWDDGSTDDSLDIAQHHAEQDARIRVIAAEHLGRGEALRRAIAVTESHYLGTLDSDDALAPTALAETVNYLQRHPQVGMVYTDYLVIDIQDRVLSRGKRCQIPYSKERLLVDFMTFHFRLMRRACYDQVGGIDPSFTYAQDYDLCLKLSEVTAICHLRQPLYAYRLHGESLSQQRRMEQAEFSRQAINNALQRRGMADDWFLEVQDGCRYAINPKQRA